MRPSDPSALLWPRGGKCHPLPSQGLQGVLRPADWDTKEERGLPDMGSDLSRQMVGKRPG